MVRLVKVTRFVTDMDPGSATPQGAVGLGTAIAGGDLTGTHGVPIVSSLAGVTITGTPSAGQLIIATSGTAAHWATDPNVNPMTTKGDIITGDTGGTPTRLAAGTSTYVLTSNGAAAFPSWQVAPSTGLLTTKGDLFGHSSVDARIPIGTDTYVLTADSSQVLGLKWAAGGGGGGIAQSFVGYNTIGGTWTALTNLRWYLKQITLSATSTFTSIDVYLRVNSDDFQSAYAVSVLTDNAGSPGSLLGLNTVLDPYLSIAATTPGPGGWRSIPMGVNLVAGTYWIGFQPYGSGGGNAAHADMANDGSGSDVTFTTVTNPYLMGAYPTGGGSYVPTVGSVKWSIRASILS